jgi:hypothetical protein
MTLLINAALDVEKTDIQKSKTRNFMLGRICISSTNTRTSTNIEAKVDRKGRVRRHKRLAPVCLQHMHFLCQYVLLGTFSDQDCVPNEPSREFYDELHVQPTGLT